MATVRRIRTVQTEGGREVGRELDFYHLDAIIAVGYRVNSREATQFRIWATQVRREYLLKGFALDDERFKQGKRLGKDYFDELIKIEEAARRAVVRQGRELDDDPCPILRCPESRLTRKLLPIALAAQTGRDQAGVGSVDLDGRVAKLICRACGYRVWSSLCRKHPGLSLRSGSRGWAFAST
jgi:hypothetical protein